MMEGKSVFLTGGAGTGKSAVTKRFLANCTDRKIAALASTGAAALLVGGQTAASFFGLGINIHKPGTVAANRKTRRLLEKTDGFIIDEVSMSRIDTVQAIHDTLKAFPKGPGPFFGYQVIFVGDFAQLPPVIPTQEKEVLEFHYGKGKSFAFQADCWNDLEIANLTTVHRQSGDAKFKDWLNILRMGEVPDLSYINARIDDADESAVCLVGSNKAAEIINSRKMADLKTQQHEFRGTVSGRISPSETKVPNEYALKVGSRVIICANNKNEGYANGSTGTFIGTGHHPKLGKSARVRLDNDFVVEVTKHKWEKLSYSLDWVENPKLDAHGNEIRDSLGNLETVRTREMVKTVEGTQEGIPLIPGWAITIHRSQGMSLPNVHIDTKGIFASGQAYVALSRATSLEGLTMENAMTSSAVRLDPAVRAYMKDISAHRPAPVIFDHTERQAELDIDF